MLFRSLFEDLRYEDAVKAVVITGAGRGFCSGGDVHKIIAVMLEWTCMRIWSFAG